MSGWAWWILAAAAFGIGEMVTGGFFLAPFGVGALGAVLVAAAGAGAGAQAAVFLALSAGSLAFLRPIARRNLRTPPQIRTGTAALVGKRALVLEQVGDHAGAVRIDGEVWTARAYLAGEVLEPGAEAHVVEIRGATALVSE